MSYTVVELQMTTGPLVAIYAIPAEPGFFEVRPIYAIGIYRDPSSKDAPNFLVPLTQADFLKAQKHVAWTIAELLDLLPRQIREHQEWFNDSQESGAITLVRNEKGELAVWGEAE